MKIKIFKIKKSFKKGGFHVDPNIYWEILLCMMFVIVVMSFLFGFFLFKRMDQEFIFSVEYNDSQTRTINKERIDKILNYFFERKQKSNQIINSPSPIVDPSR